MITIELLHDLYNHMEWADTVVWDAVEATGANDDERLTYLLYHMHATQEAFLGVWVQGAVDPYDTDRFKSLPPVREWATPYYAEVRSFLANLESHRLGDAVEVPWSKWFTSDDGGSAHGTTLGETMLQVAMHSTYHRAQINTRIRELGSTPPTVDYIVWLWRDRPAPDST